MVGGCLQVLVGVGWFVIDLVVQDVLLLEPGSLEHRGVQEVQVGVVDGGH